MATSLIPQAGGRIAEETGSTNAYGLLPVSNADKLNGIVIIDPAQCIPLYYSNSGIRILKVTETSGTFSFSWLASTTVTYRCVRGG